VVREIEKSTLIELEENLGLVSAMVPQLREQLMAEPADFGQHLGYDGKAIDSHSTGQVNRKFPALARKVGN